MRCTFSLVVYLCMLSAFAQRDSTAAHVYRHELGIDATAFLRQFLHFNTSEVGSDLYVPAHMFTYRYRLRKCNLRFGIGAFAEDNELPANWYNSAPGETYHDRSSDIAVRIGIEGYQDIGGRWQVFYGLDLRPNWSNAKTDFDYSNGGYRYGSEVHVRQWAAAPLAGVRFRITPRFSLLTETSFALMQREVKSTQKLTPQTSSYPLVPDETSTTTSFRTSYQTPLMVVATFEL